MKTECVSCSLIIKNQEQERYELKGNYCDQCIAQANANDRKRKLEAHELSVLRTQGILPKIW